MSLISESLKKARGDRPGLYPVAHPPPRRAVAPWLAAAVAVGVAAGVLIGVLVRRESTATREAMPVAVAAAVPEASGTEVTAAGTPDPPAAARSRLPTAERGTAVGQNGGTDTARPATPAPTDGSESPPASPAVHDPGPTEPAPPPPEPAAALEAQPVPAPPPPRATSATAPQQGAPTAGGSYLRRVTLPGGAELALGGIAWSEANPAALVNGQVLSPGEGSDDWIITAVERSRVEIEWQGVRFHLRLK
ncbi:MAG: hypothetical protein ACRD2Z_16445 [Thermoanaerobaculia bacterium]